ncbi:MAG: HEAT repeat domain-containing protein, partial [bacterium]|nr:HEAT repeat domain-containing protein [bacterium]
MPDQLEELVSEIEKGDVETRRKAGEAMGALNDPRAVATLTGLLGDSVWRVRKAAIASLVQMSSCTEVVSSLVSALQSTDNAGMRNGACEALVRIGSPAVPALCIAAGDPDPDVRKFAADVLGDIGDRGGTGTLVATLKDGDPNVCAAAAENLGKIGDPHAVEPLLAVLQTTADLVQYSAVEALGRIGDRRAVPDLLKCLDHRLLKVPALNALGCVGDDGLFPAVVPYI